MASNTKTVRVHGSRYRKVPGFNNYGVSSTGEVINLTRQQRVMPKDWHHWSGRYNLYNPKTGKYKTFSSLRLISMTYSQKWAEKIESGTIGSLTYS